MRRRIAFLAFASTLGTAVIAPSADAFFRKVSYCPVIRTAELRSILHRSVSAQSRIGSSGRHNWDQTCVFSVAGLRSYTPRLESEPFYSGFDVNFDWSNPAPPGALTTALGQYRQELEGFGRNIAGTPGTYYRISLPRILGYPGLAVEENVLNDPGFPAPQEILQRHVLVKKGGSTLSIGIGMPAQRLGAPNPPPTLAQLQSIIRIAARRVRFAAPFHAPLSR